MARLKLSLIFESGARIGPGKARLLESIRDSGSISAAAREMGMSYKRAWLLIDSMNDCFVEPVVEATAGGHRGGGAKLTDFGRVVLERYRRMESRACDALRADMMALQEQARATIGPKV